MVSDPDPVSVTRYKLFRGQFKKKGISIFKFSTFVENCRILPVSSFTSNNFGSGAARIRIRNDFFWI
jgi:hypothetical protein